MRSRANDHKHVFDSAAGYGQDRQTVVLFCACGQRAAFDRAAGAGRVEEKPKFPVLVSVRVLRRVDRDEWAQRFGTMLGIGILVLGIVGICKAIGF